MINNNFNRMEDPIEWKPGLDVLPDFTPTMEYTNLLNRCNSAFADILKVDELNYRLLEMKAVVEKYQDLFDEVENKLQYYEKFDNFYFLYDAIFTTNLFVNKEGRNAYYALDDYSKFDMSIERNLINWLFAYQNLNESITEHLFYNSFCNCNSTDFYRISNIGIHVHKEILINIIEFSILFCENYAYLLKQYMDISWDEFFSL